MFARAHINPHKKAAFVERTRSWKSVGPVRNRRRTTTLRDGLGLQPEATLMANVDFSYPIGRTSRFLDVSPMIEALRFQPEDFDFEKGWLNHVPSRHRFQFDSTGRVTVEANCRCAAMSIKPEQTDDLVATYNVWRREYWLPIATNREFASHFEKPNAWVRLFRDVRMAFRRFVRREPSVGLPVPDLADARVTAAE